MSASEVNSAAKRAVSAEADEEDKVLSLAERRMTKQYFVSDGGSQPQPVLRNTAGNARQSDSEIRLKMCKKIAELTMVVHLLFRQNHENELTIRLLGEHLKVQEEQLQQKHEEHLKALEQTTATLKNGATDALEKYRVQNEELLARVDVLERSVSEEQKVAARVREMLAVAEQELVELRNQLAQEKILQESSVDKRNNEISDLKAQLVDAQRQLNDLKQLDAEQTSRFAAKQLELRDQVARLERINEEEAKAKAQLQLKNAKLTQEIRQLRNSIDYFKQTSVAPSSDETSAELEALRSELVRYKMELQNREENYNRVFTQFRPVRLDKGMAKPINEREKTQINAHRLSITTANASLRNAENELMSYTDAYVPQYNGNKRESPSMRAEQPSRTDTENFGKGRTRPQELTPELVPLKTSVSATSLAKPIMAPNFNPSGGKGLLNRRKFGSSTEMSTSLQPK